MNGLINRRNSPLCAGRSEISGQGNEGGYPWHRQKLKLVFVTQVAVFGKERTLGVGACPHRASKLQTLRCMTLRYGLLQGKSCEKNIINAKRLPINAQRVRARLTSLFTCVRRNGFNNAHIIHMHDTLDSRNLPQSLWYWRVLPYLQTLLTFFDLSTLFCETPKRKSNHPEIEPSKTDLSTTWDCVQKRRAREKMIKSSASLINCIYRIIFSE